MKKLLVIGGSGYFGKSILNSFNNGELDKWGITSLEMLARNASRNLPDEVPHLLADSVKITDGDITTCKSIASADYIIHAAASSDQAKYLMNPSGELENILNGVKNFHHLLKNVEKKTKILYISSGAVYGKQPDDIEKSNESNPISCDQLLGSKKDYAFGKIESEKMIQKMGLEEGLNVSIGRCFSFIGPFLPRNKHFAIGNFIADGLAGRDIIVNAGHKVYRSYMHSDDLVSWMMNVVDHSNPEAPIFNIGSDETISIQDLAHRVATYFNVTARVPRITSDVVDRYVPSIKKAQEQLGLVLKHDLNGAIESTIKSIIAAQKFKA